MRLKVWVELFVSQNTLLIFSNMGIMVAQQVAQLQDPVLEMEPGLL